MDATQRRSVATVMVNDIREHLSELADVLQNAPRRNQDVAAGAVAIAGLASTLAVAESVIYVIYDGDPVDAEIIDTLVSFRRIVDEWREVLRDAGT